MKISFINVSIRLKAVFVRAFICMALLAGLCPVSRAANWTWDVSHNGSAGSGGSGNWDAITTNWYNGSADAAWSQTSSTVSTNGAIFAGGTDAADGAYVIALGTQIAATNILVNNSGYAFSGTSGLYIFANGGIDVAAGKTNTVNCPVVQTSGFEATSASSVLNLAGNITGAPAFVGAGIINLSSPSFTANNTTAVNVSNLNFTSGTWTQTAANLYVSYGGVNYNNAAFGTPTLNVNGGTLNQSGGKIIVCRGGTTGALILNSGAINFFTGGSGTVSGNAVIAIPNNEASADHASVNVYGGTLTLGNSSYAAQIQMMSGGSVAAETGFLTQTGGVITAWGGILFGGTSVNYSGGTAALTNSGGSLYIGAQGINFGTGGHPGTNLINLSGGIVGALANWSSTMPMTLATLNGNIMFQCADSSANPFNITLSGALTGPGGFTKTGGGTLTLSGTNTYAGATLVNGGTVFITGGGSVAGSSGFTVTNNGVLTLMNAAGANSTNRIGNAVAITMNGGTFNIINDGSVASFSEIAGAMIVNSGVNTVNVFPATNGQTSTLTFASITNYGGSVNFQAGGAGTAQNKIWFTSAPVLGGWITVNGNPAAYDAVNGLREATTYTDIAALGSTITNAPAANVRINSTGSGGNIQLGSTTTSVNSLQQNTATAAVVATANQTFQVNQLTINAGSQSLTIGASPGDGVLAAGSMGGNLALVNNSGSPQGLIINAVLADNIFPSSLTVFGSGTVTLAAPNNTFSGGTTISNGTLAVTTGTTVTMPYANLGGTLSVKRGAAGTILPMSSFTSGGGSPQLTFGLGGANSSVPLINVGGNLTLNTDVRVNVTNPVPGTSVLLQYNGSRSGTGRFLPGNVPAGVGIIDDPVSHQVNLIYISGPTVIVPPHNTNELIVAAATPQQYGAVGDGVTDDTAAFQNAMNAVNNAGGFGGGVVYVPSGVYAFSNTLSIPPGVTLHGDWMDWSLGTSGVMGTLFKVYAGVGQSNGTPFITINNGALTGVSIWYPNENPAGITPYPFTLQISGDTLVQDVALINSYQGILGIGAAKHIISRVIGSPLYTGIQVDQEYDISQQEDVRFSPDYWSASLLPGAPAAGGLHATWMRANGTAERLYRADGEACMDVNISGYHVGFYSLQSTNGNPSTSFYGGYISNCATAFLDATGGGNTGMEFTDVTLDGDLAVDHNSATNNASAYFHTCRLIGHTGTAIHMTGGSASKMQFQSCNVSGTVKLDGGIVNFVNSSFTVPAGSNHCAMASGAIYAAFTGCDFNPARQISSAADARRLVIDGRRASTSPLPLVNWSDIQNNRLTRRPAKLDLFFAANAAGDGVADDTAAIQSALNAASTNGGGIVYLPAGKYKLTGTLDVPGGVELRGSYPSVHPAPLYDGHVKITVLQPYAGAGTTNGPPAVALEASAGIVGMTIQYELQDTNCTPYPPTIQGRGGNVYAIGVLCPNPYWLADLNTYTCTNHFLQQVDGWALRYGFRIGNGSCGTLVQCMANETYWDDSNFSASQDIGAWRPAIESFAFHNLEWFVLGDCRELLAKNFQIFSHIFMHCIDQNGRGPWINGILTQCDAAVECFQFDAAAPCQINIVNPEWMVTLDGGYGDMTNYGVISTPTFQGTARFFNAPLWGGRSWDYWIQGGDVGFELVHMGYLSTYGTKVDGGVIHLINCGFEGNTSSYYTVPFNSASASVPGKLSEIIGCYAWTGVTNSRVNINNPINSWGNFGINQLTTQAPFNVTPPQLLFSPSLAAQTVSLSWTNNMGAFNLYSTPDLAPPVIWTAVTNAPYFATNRWAVVDSTINSLTRFYRLGP